MSYFTCINWNVIKDFASVLQSLGILIGLVVGGWWTYRLFMQNRQKYPRANLTHKIFHIKLPNNKIYLQVKIIIANVGNVLICLESGFTRISQILPLAEDITNNFDNSKREIDWRMLGKKEITKEIECEIEPSESDEVNFDFLIDYDVELINIYSYFLNIKNIKKKSILYKLFKKERDIGWQITTIYDLKEVEHV